jgi:ATPase subunit of ABC transporter with duplicated ATPase domains
MYGDTTVIRGLARQLDEQAGEIVRDAHRLVAQADACPWSGWAADAMRRRSHERAAALHRAAGRHREAADALDRHADRVDQVVDLIAAAERRISRLLGGLGELVESFVPPPPGHRDWLRTELPRLPA